MTDDSPMLDSEIDAHKTNINGWIEGISKLSVPESRKGVNERFVRDCKTLLKDLNETTLPSSADLVDFEDAHNGLEVRYHALTDDNE
jgi:hypothetical protein